jgi:hypothetical protein
MTNTTKTIDMTPTWESLIPAILLIIRSSKQADAQNMIQQELVRMAQAADKWNTYCKENDAR